MTRARLGRMAYINTLPVDWELAKGRFSELVSVHRGTPTILNRLMAEGKLDVSPVSSVAAAEHADDWLVFDHLCIGCRGDVGSVVLHSDVPVEQLNGRCIAVTAASATAAKLLQVLLARHWKVEAPLVSENGKTLPRLLIGDPALKVSQSEPEGFLYDLGRAWQDYTGLDFIFGLWCVRRAFAEEHPQETWVLYHLLRTSRSSGRTEAAGVIAEAAGLTGLSEAKIKSYFDKLVYDLDAGLWKGLEHFLRLLGYEECPLQRFGGAEHWEAPARRIG